MSLTTVVLTFLILTVCIGFSEWHRRRRKRLFFLSHTIDADHLHDILSKEQRDESIKVIDVRQPLDLLANSQIIAGSERIPPKQMLDNLELLRRDQYTVLYCTCPTDETASKVMQKAVSLGFEKVKVLQGGLDAWKEKSYPVEPYRAVFHLDTPTW